MTFNVSGLIDLDWNSLYLFRNQFSHFVIYHSTIGELSIMKSCGGSGFFDDEQDRKSTRSA